MGTWNTFKSSYQSQGIFSGNGNYHPEGQAAAFKALGMGMKRPTEGFAHALKRGVVDSFIEQGHSGHVLGNAVPRAIEGGRVFSPQSVSGRNVRYGGSIFSSGGMREVMHKTEQVGMSGFYKLGARRSALGMLGTGAMKAITPAFFLYNAATQGIGQATEDAVVQGAVFGAARWTLGRIGMGLAHPAVLAAAAVVGTGIAAQKALVMGKRYNESVRKVSFGNAFNDVYGTAATMRQASLMAIQSSKINGRNAIGAEASLMHMR